MVWFKNIIFLMNLIGILLLSNFVYGSSENDKAIPEGVLNTFPSQDVKLYIEKVVNSKFSTMVFPAPKDFTDVVNTGKTAVPFLIKLFNNKDSAVRLSALIAFQKITNKHFLITYFAEDTKEIKKKRIVVIKEIKRWWNHAKNESRIQWLIEDLKSKNKRDKESAVVLLGESGDKQAIPALRKALKDEKIRFYVIESLADLEDECMTPYVINSYLDNVDKFYRERGPILIEKLTGENFGFDSNADQKSREEAIDKAKEWWEKNKDKYDCNF
jgi:hypothetical protein